MARPAAEGAAHGPDVVLDRRGGGLPILAGPARRPCPRPGPVLALRHRLALDPLRADLRRAPVRLAAVAAAGPDLLGDPPRGLEELRGLRHLPPAGAAPALYPPRGPAVQRTAATGLLRGGLRAGAGDDRHRPDAVAGDRRPLPLDRDAAHEPAGGAEPALPRDAPVRALR